MCIFKVHDRLHIKYDMSKVTVTSIMFCIFFRIESYNTQA